MRESPRLGCVLIYLVDALQSKRLFPGPEIDVSKLVNMLYHRDDVSMGFKYPPERLLKLHTNPSENDLHTIMDQNGDLCVYVFKLGRTTFATIGRFTGFETHARYYFPNETNRDSVELAVLPYDKDSGPFSKVGAVIGHRQWQDCRHSYWWNWED